MSHPNVPPALKFEGRADVSPPTPIRRLSPVARRLPPLLLIAAGLVALGCLPLPGTFDNVAGDRRPEQKIGRPGSDAPIVLGESDGDRVVEVLGTPAWQREGGRVLRFDYAVVSGYLLSPLCFTAARVDAQRYLAVAIDEGGVVQNFRVFVNANKLEAWAERAVPLSGGEGTP